MTSKGRTSIVFSVCSAPCPAFFSLIKVSEISTSNRREILKRQPSVLRMLNSESQQSIKLANVEEIKAPERKEPQHERRTNPANQ